MMIVWGNKPYYNMTVEDIRNSCRYHRGERQNANDSICFECDNYMPALSNEPGLDPVGTSHYYPLDPNDPFEYQLIEMAKLQRQKAQDYGTGEDPNANLRAIEGFGLAPWVGCAIRMNDKMFRIQSFVRNGHLANEAVEDSLLDIAVYAIKSLCFMKEENK